MAALQSYISVTEDLIIETRHFLLNIINLGIEVQFCWVSAHTGIKGNEKADKIAKEALEEEQVIMNTSMGKGGIKAKIKCEIMQIWQKEWESEIKTKHYYINQSKVRGYW